MITNRDVKFSGYYQLEELTIKQKMIDNATKELLAKVELLS
jgi:hypothetical protein